MCPQQVCNDTKLGVVADMPYCCTAVQKNLNKLGKEADRNLMVFNKCSVLHLERKTSGSRTRESNQMERSFAEKDLRVLVDTKLNVRQ